MSIDSNHIGQSNILRFLIADDRESDRKLTRHAIRQSGLICSCVEVGGIAEAFSACERQTFDCAFIDNMSSSENGLGNLSALARQWPQMPVIMITSFGDEKTAAEAIQLGAADYIRKADLTGDAVRQSVEDAMTMFSLRHAAMKHLEDLESFASVLAHDLNAPIASLQLFAHTLEQTLGSANVDREDLVELCREVVNAGVRTATLIDALHNYTKPDREFALSTIEMSQVLKDAESNLAYMIRSRGAEISHDELPSVDGNAPFLVELMQNLLSNAIKYCIADRPRIHVSAQPGSNESWAFMVVDNGIGIPADRAELLFEPFKRLHSEGEYSGSGLGLAISRKIVERHGGAIRGAANEDGVGSRFSFTLPRAGQKTNAAPVDGRSPIPDRVGIPEKMAGPVPVDLVTEPAYERLPELAFNGSIAAAAIVYPEDSIWDDSSAILELEGRFDTIPATPRRNGPPKLLIADDDPGIVRFLSQRCRKMGFEVRSASNGLQALALAKQFQPDVVIIDINMPEADGLSVVMRLLLPGNRPMEAIVITASSYEESAPRCEGIGAVYIRKGEGLLDKIREALLVMFPDLDSWEDDEGANTPAKAEQWTRPRVLVVGADLDLDDFLSSRLQKYDIDTVTARDGMRGFYTACTEEPSVVVTKYTMPNGDAQFLLQKLRSQPETANLPVFIISDEDVDEVKQARMRSDTLNPSGVVQFFTQPIDADEFFAALGRYCALAMNPNPRENISVAS